MRQPTVAVITARRTKVRPVAMGWRRLARHDGSLWREQRWSRCTWGVHRRCDRRPLGAQCTLHASVARPDPAEILPAPWSAERG